MKELKNNHGMKRIYLINIPRTYQERQIEPNTRKQIDKKRVIYSYTI